MAAHRSQFNHTMLRVKDPKASIAFYEDILGMELIHCMSYTLQQPFASTYSLASNREQGFHAILPGVRYLQWTGDKRRKEEVVVSPPRYILANEHALHCLTVHF